MMDRASIADIRQYIGDAIFPCSRDELVDFAREQGADSDILHTLQDLERQQFNTPEDVEAAVDDMEF